MAERRGTLKVRRAFLKEQQQKQLCRRSCRRRTHTALHRVLVRAPCSRAPPGGISRYSYGTGTRTFTAVSDF